MKGLLFVYLLTYGGAAAALVRPYVGLLIYICFAILRPEALWFWCVEPGNYSRIVALAVIGAWLLHGMGSWKLNRSTAITFALLFYLGWTTLRAFGAPNQEKAWYTVETLSKIIIPFIVGITLINSVDKLKQLAWVLLLSTGYLSQELISSYLAGYNLAEDDFSGQGRAVLGAGLVCCVWLAYFIAMDGRIVWWQRLIAAVCGLLIGNTICITFSRGAMLGVLVSGVVVFFLMKKTSRHYLGFGVAAIIAAVLAGPQVRDRFSTIFASKQERDASAESRIELWGNCLTLIREEPLMGIGPGHFILASQRFGWQRPKEAHSTWLQTGAELGIPGVLALFGFHGLTLYRLLQLVRAREKIIDPWCQTLSYAVVAGLIGFMVSSLFVTLYELETPYYLVLLGAGILKVSSNQEISEGGVLADSRGISLQPCDFEYYQQMDFQRSSAR